MPVAEFGHMTMDLEVLKCGNCEELKAGVHAAALGLFVVMGGYNVAAWLSRRQTHLAINAVIYAALTAWEQQHVAHHLAELNKLQNETPRQTLVPEPAAAELAA
jgi:hypothetical protein